MRSSLAAALIGALYTGGRDVAAGPAPRKFFTVDRSAPTCNRDCRIEPTTTEDGREIKTIVHSYGCRVALAAHNQAVDNRQTRRYYARIMAKRGRS